MRRQIMWILGCLCILGIVASSAGASGSEWTAPLSLAGHAGLGPGYADAGVSQAAIGANGTIVVTGYTGDTRSTDGHFQTWVVSPSGRGHVVEVGESTDSVAFDGSTPFLLNQAFRSFAASPECCTHTYVRRAGIRTVSAPTPIVTDLSVFNADLIPVGRRLLAATVSTAGASITWRSPAGVWDQPHVVGDSGADEGFGILSAAAGDRVAVLAGGSYLGTGASGQPLQRLPIPAPRLSGDNTPSGVAVVGSHVSIIENDTSTSDGYELAEATPHGLVDQMSVPGVAGLAQVAGDDRGDEIFVWQSCETGCPLQAVYSRHGGPLSAPQTLATNTVGSLSAEAAMTADGTGIIAWASEGHVETALLSPHASRFSAEDQITTGGLDEGNPTPLTLSTGTDHNALLTWQNATGDIELQRLR